MKLSFWLLGSFAAFAKVMADKKAAAAASSHPVEDAELKNYHIDYTIEEHPDVSPAATVELLQGDTITLLYGISNEEDSVITIVGLGGAFLNPLTGEPAINMTANSVDVLLIEPQSFVKLRQRIPLQFAVGNYVLTPHVYVAFHDQLKVIPGRGQLVSVTEPPVSMFNPQLLFLELVFAGIVGYVIYFYFGTALDQYFKGTAPVGKSGKSLGSSSGVENSWIPNNYHPVQRKARKAY